MLTFREVADFWLKQNSADNIDCKLVFSDIGDLEIEELSSEKAQGCLVDLYDNKKLRGAVYASYEKFVTNVCKYAFECGYIPEIPKIEHRNEPAPNLYCKPDDSAMLLLLSHEDLTPTGTILRLAWHCGLMRSEITYLLWWQVDLGKKRLVLPERSVPLTKEMSEYLSRLKKENAGISEYVLLSQRKTAPLAEQSVSALARKALDNYGQKDIRLNDLRCDFIVRQLEVNSREYVSYISGVELSALRKHYLPHAVDEKIASGNVKSQLTQSDRRALRIIIEKEKTGIAGLSLRFVWQFGIPVSVLPRLTWDIIDFDEGTMTFADRIIYISSDFISILLSVKNSQDGEYGNILLNENRKKPIDAVFLQKTVRQALISCGVSGISLSDLQNDYWRKHYSDLKLLTASGTLNAVSGRTNEIYSIPGSFPSEVVKPSEDRLLDYLRKNGAADSRTMKSSLGYSDREISLLLRDCMENGKIVRVGVRYFLPDTVVERERQKEVILEYVRENQPVTSAQLTNILGLVERRQVFGVINPLLQAGEMIRVSKNSYCLPVPGGDMETA